jgi:hypothetical protein
MQSNSTVLSVLAQPQWAVLFLVAFWFIGAALMARVAGWSSLAQQFAASEIPIGQSFRFVSGSLGSAHWPIKYRNCLRIVVGNTGLYVSVMFPFKFRSPALLLPWHDIESIQEKQSFSTRTVIFRIRGQWSAVSLPGPVGQLAKTAYEKALSQNAP